MLSNSKYHRSFIILKTLDSGYSIDDRKEPAGYCKMEIKKNQGKILLYVQDMKPAEPQQSIYDVVMISTKDGVPPVKLTSIQIPDHGRGEYEITFDPESVNETGIPVDQFHALAVVHRFLSGEGRLRYPLVGYSDKRVQLDWAGDVTNQLNRIYNKKRSPSNTNTASVKNQSVGVMSFTEQTIPVEQADEVRDNSNDGLSLEKTEAQETIEALSDQLSHSAAINEESVDNQAEDLLNWEEDIKQVGITEELIEDEAIYNKLDGTYQPEENKDSVPVGEFEDDGINPELLEFEPPDISYIYEDIEVDDHKKVTRDSPAVTESSEAEVYSSPYSIHLGDRTYWDKVKDYFNRLFENHKKVIPFDDAVGEVDWIRVENRNEPLYPSYRANGFYGHRTGYLDHYLVGLVRNMGKVQYVVYGIPGVYSMVPPMSMHGFSRWLPVKNGYGAGYWLLYIDAISGNIAYPY